MSNVERKVLIVVRLSSVVTGIGTIVDEPSEIEFLVRVVAARYSGLLA